MTSWLRHILKGVLTLGVLVALALSVDLSAMEAASGHIRWGWVLLALALLPVNLALDAVTWGWVLSDTVSHPGWTTVGKATLGGITLGFWTPVQVGEYAGRALGIDADPWAVSLTVFAQRMVDMGVGVAFGLVGLGVAFGMGVVPLTLPWLAALGLGVGTLGLLGVAGIRRRWLVRHLPAGLPGIAGVARRARLFRRMGGRTVRWVCGGAGLRYLVFAGQFVCLGAAFAPHAALPTLGLAATLTYYAKYLLPSLTLLDVGLREGAAAGAFALVGLSPEIGVCAALSIFLINLALPAALGVPFVVENLQSEAHSLLPAPLSISPSSR